MKSVLKLVVVFLVVSGCGGCFVARSVRRQT